MLTRSCPFRRLSAALIGAMLIGSAVLPSPARAEGFGLAPPPAEALWPRWQARVTVQTAALPLSAGPGRWAAAAGADKTGAGGSGLLGGAVLGDYHFAGLGFGSLRASGGVRIGAQGGLPLAPGPVSGALPSQTTGALSHLGWSVLGSGAAALPGVAGDGSAAGTLALPYLGLGFSGAWWGLLSLSADVGYVAERPSAAAGVGRALFGNQGVDRSLRELRLSPVLQLGLRYAF